jgi:hypothetical protein
MKLPPNDISSIEYEMGYGADEFGNVLTGPFSGVDSGYQCQVLNKHHWQIGEGNSDLKVDIKVKEMPPRKIALFSLPVLQVCFNMEKSEPETQGKFFARFFKYFHKGGG